MFSLTVKALRAMIKDKTHHLGAALSYYAIFSLVPLLVLSLSLASFALPDLSSQDQLLEQISLFFGGPVATLISSAVYSIQNSEQGALATVLIVLVLFFGASGVFRQLKDALNAVWKVNPKKRELSTSSLLTKNVLAALTIFFTGALLIFWTLLNIANSFLREAFLSPRISMVFWQGMNFAGIILIGTILVAIIFAVFPDKKLKVADMLLPALITVILFSVLRFLFSIYLSIWDIGSIYGSAGTVVVFLIWIYLLAQVLLFGAEFSKAYINHKGIPKK